MKEYYDNVNSVEAALAKDIIVTAGNTTSGINAKLALGSHIKGTVTDEAGNPLKDIQVIARYFNGEWWDSASQVSTDVNGNFNLGGLSTNTYHVEFKDNSGIYAKQYYDNANIVNIAKSIIVTADNNITDINAQLVFSCHIKGRVTDEAGNPLQGIQVIARYFDGQWWEGFMYVDTDANGYYDFGGLNANTYRVEFKDPSGKYIRESYNNAKTIKLSKDIIVTAGGTVDNINSQLSDVAGRITGTVTDATGKPLQNVGTTVYYWDGKGWDRFDYDENTDSNGHYEQSGLSPGIYRVGIWDNSETYATTYYKDAHLVQNATDVIVKANETNSDINVQFTTLSGQISRKITDADGNYLKDIGVFSYHWNGSRWQLQSFIYSRLVRK